MDKLKRHREELLKKYREVFVSVLASIQGELNGLTPNKIREYLEKDLEKHIQSQRKEILERRKKFNCAKCGACCRLAISEFSPKELLVKAQSGDEFAKEFISTFEPYLDESTPKSLYGEYVDLINESGETVYYYHCKKVTDGNLCPDYENRPAICRDYPDDPIQMLHPTCAFTGWHEDIQIIVLTIRAMNEVRHHFLNELAKENL